MIRFSVMGWKVYLGLALATILAGLILRLGRFGLPFAVVKWGGSVLWAVMVYWIFAALLPNWRVCRIALVAGVFAGAVELLRLYHAPWLDAFRITLPGILLLGRVFSYWHFAVYWASIALTAFVDLVVIRGRR